MIQIPLEIGDIILAGRFKNKKIIVKEISVDEFGNPTVNGRSILKIRIPKLYMKENDMKINENYKFSKEIAIRTGLRQSAVDKFLSDNNIDDFELVQAIGRKKIKPIDVSTAISGSPNNKFAQELVKKFALKESVAPFQKSPTQVKIKQEDGRWHIFLQTVDGEECLTMSGWDTKENAEHAAMMKGYSFDGNKSNETFKREQPKYTGYEKVRSEKPEEMKLSKEKKIEIKLERMIREILGKKKVLNEQYTKNDLKFVDGKALVKKGNKILAKVFDREAYFKAQNVNVSFSPKYPYSLTINAMTRECESLDEVLTYLNKYLNESALVEAAGTRKLKKQIEDFIYTKLGKRPYKGQIRFKGNVLVIDNSEISFGNYASWIAKNATGLKWEPIGQSMAKLVESVLIESNLTDNIKTQLRTLKDLQQKIAEAKAQVDAIIKSTGLKDLEKSADKLLKEELWDFFNELKRDEQRLVDLGDIIMTVTKFQSEPATYEYEKTLDYALTQVNQDVKEKVLMQLKATEKIGKTKGSVSFATKTESVGSDIWNKVTSFLGKFLPAIKRKGQKIDSEISKLKSLINKK
jgi:hypothetical protein